MFAVLLLLLLLVDIIVEFLLIGFEPAERNTDVGFAFGAMISAVPNAPIKSLVRCLFGLGWSV